MYRNIIAFEVYPGLLRDWDLSVAPVIVLFTTSIGLPQLNNIEANLGSSSLELPSSNDIYSLRT